MKKLVIISLAIFGLGIVSCQKQDIVPNSGSELEVPVWDENARGSIEEETGFDDHDVIVGGITDPDEEEDESGGNTLKKGSN